MDGESRKVQEKWNKIPETSSQRDSVVFSTNYRVRDGEAWMCLDHAVIPSRVWYRMPLYIKLETEPPIMSSILDLEQAREGCRRHDRLSTPMYENMLIISNSI